MKIDVDEIVNRVLPWECEITIGGVAYNLRAPTLADMDTLAKFEANKKLSEIDAAGLISSLFAEPKPPLAELDFPRFNFVAQVVTSYIRDYLSKKNSALLLQAAGIGAEDRTNGTSSSSSPPSASPVPARTPSAL